MSDKQAPVVMANIESKILFIRGQVFRRQLV